MTSPQLCRGRERGLTSLQPEGVQGPRGLGLGSQSSGRPVLRTQAFPPVGPGAAPGNVNCQFPAAGNPGVTPAQGFFLESVKLTGCVKFPTSLPGARHCADCCHGLCIHSTLPSGYGLQPTFYNYRNCGSGRWRLSQGDTSSGGQNRGLQILALHPSWPTPGLLFPNPKYHKTVLYDLSYYSKKGTLEVATHHQPST